MATVQVRYIVRDLDACVAFYVDRLGFTEAMRPSPQFAMLTRGDLRLVLSVPGGDGPGGGSQAVGGQLPEPGGWTRFAVEVANIDETVGTLQGAGAHFRGDISLAVGGDQARVEHPSGDPVALVQATRQEAR